jgi:hypothetical protein
MTSETSPEGGCQCGAVRYRLTGTPQWLTICHCNECKRQSGSAFGMSLRMRACDVELISGELREWSRAADSGVKVSGFFCPTCGTRMWHEPVGSGFLHIKPGTLDAPSRFEPKYEAWIERKAGWLSISGLRLSFEGQNPPPAET